MALLMRRASASSAGLRCGRMAVGRGGVRGTEGLEAERRGGKGRGEDGG